MNNCRITGPTLLMVVLALIGSHVGAPAQTESPVTKINAQAATSDVTAQRIRSNVSVLMGSGGNIAVLTGSDGILMVDAGIAVSRAKIAAALTKIAPGPVKYVINTHWHWDHADGDAWLHKLGATIIAHPNTLTHLSTTVTVGDWSHTFQAVPPDGRPTVLVKTSKTILFDGNSVLIKYYGPAHTDGDLAVYFPKDDVLLTGDTWWNGVYPFIDVGAGGSIDGMIQAAGANIAMVTDKTIIVPGHGPVGTRDEMIEYRNMLVAIRNNVSALKKQGKSEAEVVAAKPSSAFDAKWGKFVIDPAFFTRLIYKSL